MFNFKRNVKKELNDLWTEINNHKNQLDKAFLERKSFETQLEIVKVDKKERKEKIDTLLQMIEGQDKYLQKITPSFNKQEQKIKKLEENYHLLIKVVEKIVSKIEPEWDKKTVKKRN